jgi:acyl-CoA synthetase (AMP-forming)/AMP-acid ligase II
MAVSENTQKQALGILHSGPNVADALDALSRRQPGDVAVKWSTGSMNFAQLASRTRQLAGRLREAGVRAGDRVGLLDLNSPAYFYLFFALGRLGAVFVPINFRLARPEIDFIVADAELKLLFVGEAFDAIAPVLTSMKSESILRQAQDGVVQTWFGNWAESDSRDGGGQAPATAAGNCDFLQLYTSGTTGHPKGVLADHSQYLAFIEAVVKAGWGAYPPGQRLLVAMPMFHVAGLNMAMLGLLQGGTDVVLPAVDPEAILRSLVAEKIQSMLMAPAVLQLLVQHPLAGQLSFPHLEEVIYGASPISEALQARVAKTFDCGLVQVYGLTENLGIGTYLGIAEHEPERGLLRSCGKAYPGSQLKIVDQQGEPVAPGQVGEIVTRSGWTMKGYWKRPEETRKALEDGWLHTGDAAYMNDDGYVFIFDRVKDMIISGGENVYPAEVENALAGFPGVRQVAVIGVPDEKWGEAVKAIVIMDEGQSLDTVAIQNYAARKIARYKLPRSYDVVESLPMNATGKILKTELRKKYWTGLHRNIG